MADSRKRKEARPGAKAATTTAKKKKAKTIAAAATTATATDLSDDGPSRCGYVDPESGLACVVPTLPGARCGVHARAQRATAEAKTSGRRAAAPDVSVKIDKTTGDAGGGDDDEVQAMDKPPKPADDAAAVVSPTKSKATSARARRKRIAAPEKADLRIELPNAPATADRSLKPAFRVECLTVPVSSAPPPSPLVPPSPSPPPSPLAPPASLVASNEPSLGRSATTATAAAAATTDQGGGGGVKTSNTETRGRIAAVEPMLTPMPVRAPNALASLLASERPRTLLPAVASAAAAAPSATTGSGRKVAPKVGAASVRLAAGNRRRRVAEPMNRDDDAGESDCDDILSSDDDDDDDERDGRRFAAKRKPAAAAATKQQSREQKSVGDRKKPTVAPAARRKPAAKSPRRRLDGGGGDGGAAKKRARRKKDESREQEQDEEAAAAAERAAPKPYVAESTGSTTPVRARRQSRSPPSQRAQPLSRTGLAILRGLEPGVRHICGDSAPSYHVVELLDAADRERTSAVAQAVAACNLPHLALWQRINDQTIFGRRDLQHAAASDNRAIQAQHKDRDEDTDGHRGSVGYVVDANQLVPCTDASRATPLLRHRLLHAHFSCAKGPSRYWCVRMRGDRCVYDTFWHDAGSGGGGGRRADADGSAIAELLRRSITTSAAAAADDGVAHPLESRYTMLTDVSVPAFPWPALAQHPARFVYHQKHEKLLTHVSRIDPVTLELVPSPPESASFAHALLLSSSSSSSSSATVPSSSSSSSSSSPATALSSTGADTFADTARSVPREKRRGVGGGDGCVEQDDDDGDDKSNRARVQQWREDGEEKSPSVAAVAPAWSSTLAGKRETTVTEYRTQVNEIAAKQPAISPAYKRLLLEATPLALLRLGSSYDESRILRTEYPWPNPSRVAPPPASSSLLSTTPVSASAPILALPSLSSPSSAAPPSSVAVNPPLSTASSDPGAQ